MARVALVIVVAAVDRARELGLVALSSRRRKRNSQDLGDARSRGERGSWSGALRDTRPRRPEQDASCRVPRVAGEAAGRHDVALGPLPDQAALYGVIVQLELGLEPLAVRSLRS